MTSSEEIDGVSFLKRVTNLVNIDNAIGSSEPNNSSQANDVNISSQPNVASSSRQVNVVNGSSQANVANISSQANVADISSQANVANGSSQANQVDPHILKKALEECIKEIEISTNRIEELNSRSSMLRQFTYQVLGFHLVFQGAMIAVAFSNTSYFDRRASAGILYLSCFVHMLCYFAIGDNAISAVNLSTRKIRREEIRLQIYERYKREILFYGVEFQFDTHQEIKDFALVHRPLVWSGIKVGLFYVLILTFMSWISLFTVDTADSVISAKKSALASAAPAPAPSAPVQSGNPGKTWCVAKAGSPDMDLMNGLNFACGPKGGADCGTIRAGGACFSPDTIVSHASFAYNTYYQNMGRNTSYCYFGGTSIITITDPSYSGCRFL